MQYQITNVLLYRSGFRQTKISHANQSGFRHISNICSKCPQTHLSSFFTFSVTPSLEGEKHIRFSGKALICSCVGSFISGVCLVSICSSYLFFWCLGKVVLRDCGISWVFMQRKFCCYSADRKLPPHHENMPVNFDHLKTPLLYSKAEVYRGIHYFSYFAKKT